MPATAREYELADWLITRQIDLFRLSAGERRTALAVLTRMEEDLVDRLRSAKLTDIGRQDTARLLRQCQEVIDRYYGEAGDEIGANLATLGRDEAAASATALGAAFQGHISPALPTASYFDTLVRDTLIQGAPSADWWRRQAGDTAFRFANEVRQGLAQSETNDQIIRRVQGGVMDAARHNVAALVNTSVATVSNASRRETWGSNGDIVKGVKQLSTLDSHTSVVCVAYSGGTWRLDGTPIAPTTLAYNGGTPRHFNCRSVELPLLKTFRELGLDIPEPQASTRASVDGQVAAGTTFADFLDRKGKTFTDELLGPGRAELWRDGKLTLPQLLDQTGRPLSLDELRKRYG